MQNVCILRQMIQLASFKPTTTTTTTSTTSTTTITTTTTTTTTTTAAASFATVVNNRYQVIWNDQIDEWRTTFNWEWWLFYLDTLAIEFILESFPFHK